MKRKELQALCKEHRIPANLKNFEMANKLTSLLKVFNFMFMFMFVHVAILIFGEK